MHVSVSLCRCFCGCALHYFYFSSKIPCKKKNKKNNHRISLWVIIWKIILYLRFPKLTRIGNKDRRFYPLGNWISMQIPSVSTGIPFSASEKLIFLEITRIRFAVISACFPVTKNGSEAKESP